MDMQRGGGAVATIAVILLVLLPIFYVLAIGPIVWLNDRNYINLAANGTVATIYWPLEALCEKSPLAERVIGGYADLWRAPSPPYTPVAVPAPTPSPQPAPATGGS
jgi:hypothetical protein